MKSGLVATVAVLALAGCPGTLEDKQRFLTDGGGGGCPDVPALFAARCAGSACHEGSSPAASLDLAAPGVGERVKDRPAQVCSGAIADPTDPAGSVLVIELGPDPACGGPMPPSGQALTNEEIACVEAWIAGL